MAVLKIITYPDRRLRVRCSAVGADFDHNALVRKLTDMSDTLKSLPNGLALAANQVGIPERLLVFRQGGALDIDPWVVNPRITSRDGIPEPLGEGCLSFPELWREVHRWPSVSVEWGALGPEGQAGKSGTFTGLAAQAWQHELAHLDGVLFIDDLPQQEREKIALKMVAERKRR